MILDFIDGPLNEDSWVKLCDSCYRMRYQVENYQKIYVELGEDEEINGFTKTGIVYKCYCPQRDYTNGELYVNICNKVTKSIEKLLDLEYAKKLKSYGINDIKELHLVIPQYKDARIIQYVEVKRKEVLDLKKTKPQDYDYINNNFIIVVKVAEDFRIELTRIVRSNLSNVKLNLAVYHYGEVDWSKCDSEKVENIKRKVKAVMNGISEFDEDYRDVINIYVEAYIKGLDILKKLRVSYSEVYEDIYSLEQSCKREVSLKTKMNTNSSINLELFNEIMNDFEIKLKDEFSSYLSIASIKELKIDLISGWLADCSMQFRSR